MHRFKRKALLERRSFGEVAEWSIAAVLKTVVLRGTRGSNPCLSAINAENQRIAKQTPNFTPKNVKLGVFVLFKKTAEQYKIARQFFTISNYLINTIRVFDKSLISHPTDGDSRLNI